MRTKDEIFQRVLTLRDALFPGRSGVADCLGLATAGIITLRAEGIQAVMQAGTMNWKMVADELDDGTSPTHFTYEWSPDAPASKRSVAMGNLPEMHCWIGVVSSQELIDFSTHGLVARAREAGFVWRAPEPPPFLWCAVNEQPDYVRYAANMIATQYAGSKAVEMINQYKMAAAAYITAREIKTLSTAE